MNILLTVEIYDPVFGGGAAAVVRRLAGGLVAGGHRVTVATSDIGTAAPGWENGVRVETFHIRGNRVRGIKGEAERFAVFLRGGQFDMMMNYAAQTWHADIAMELLEGLPYPAVFAPCGYSALRDPVYAEYFAQLPSRLARYRRVICHSAGYQDYAFGVEHGLSNHVVIPNGADEKEFAAPPSGDLRGEIGITTPYLLLTVANHIHDKGHAFLVDMLSRLRRDDVTLVIVGNPTSAGWKRWRDGCYRSCRLRALRRRDVRLIVGAPRESVIAAYFAADLFVFGSSVECSPLVILETLAAGRPFVTRPVGNVRDYGPYGEVVETADEMAGSVDGLLNDVERRRRIGEAGRAFWMAERTWDRIFAQYEGVFASVVEGRRA